MKKLVLTGLLSAGLVLAGFSAQAGYGRYYGHGGYGYGHGRHGGDGALIAFGIIGGAILLGSLLSRPRYHAPPVYYRRAPVYYRPAPAYVPTCYQDEVWRRLPDGRIQTGVRTRCY